MELNDVRVELNLPEGIENNNKYVITLSDSNEYARMYTLLDKNDSVYLDDLQVGNMISEHSSILKFIYGDEEFTVSLEANFDEDIYKVVVERI